MPAVIAPLAGLIATELGASAFVAGLVTIGTSVGVSVLAPKPKAPQNSQQNLDRLRASIDPRTPRKICAGTSAMGLDVR